MGEEVCGLVGGRRLEAPRKEKNGNIMLLLGKFLKSSLKDSVVFSQVVCFCPLPRRPPGQRELWFRFRKSRALEGSTATRAELSAV